MDRSHTLPPNPPLGAKVLMARATIAGLHKLPLPVIVEHSGHIRANGHWKEEQEAGISQGVAGLVWQRQIRV